MRMAVRLVVAVVLVVWVTGLLAGWWPYQWWEAWTE